MRPAGSRSERTPPTGVARGRILALGGAAALALAACASASSTPGVIESASIIAPASGTPAASGALDELGSPVEGVLIDIDAAGLSDVAGFTLRLDDGREVAFRLGTLENGAAFPPGHLAEHLATSSPVRVFFRADGSELAVYRIEDAPVP